MVRAGDILAGLVGPYLAGPVGPYLAVLVAFLAELVPLAAGNQVLQTGDTQAVVVELHLAVGSLPGGNLVQEHMLAVGEELQDMDHFQMLQTLEQLTGPMVLHTQWMGLHQEVVQILQHLRSW